MLATDDCVDLTAGGVFNVGMHLLPSVSLFGPFQPIKVNDTD